MFKPDLIVVASLKEAQALFPLKDFTLGINPSDEIDVLVTGVGLVNTIFELSNFDFTKYTAVLNLGIAGVYPKYQNDFPLGSLVEIKSETMADFGAEDQTEFIVFEHERLEWPIKFPDILMANGVSVNSCTGTIKTANLREQMGAIESMEGYAIAKVLKSLNIDFAIVRSISNVATTRDTTKWEFAKSFKALRSFLNGRI